MTTQIKSGSPQAIKLFNAALFTESVRRNSFTNSMTGDAPKSVDMNKADGNRKQTHHGAPVIRITDLGSGGGDEVTVDLVQQLRQKPVMGDRRIAGKGAALKFSSFTLKIDQGRTLVESGGKMSQQRTMHNLRNLARSLLNPYYNALEDQLCLVHMAGARGSSTDPEWVVPLADDQDFDEITVNKLTPPTYDRHVFGGDATSLENIDSADTFTLGDVDKLRLFLDEMPFPLQPIKFEKDPMAEEDPFHVLWVTPRQWNDFWTSTSGNEWRAIVAEAHQRRSRFNHPVFMGECAMWQGILVKKIKRPIRFNPGDTVDVSLNDAQATVSQVTPGVTVDRAILVGGQALANAYGGIKKRSSSGRSHFHYHEELTDHENSAEHSLSWMNGKAKIRFKGTDGRTNDFGVIALDTAIKI